MSKKALSILIVCLLTFVVLPIGTVVGLWYSNSVQGNKSEVQINTMYKNGKNILGQFTAKLAELAQVREMSINDQVKIIEAVFGEEGRAGNKAAWQWVQEQNPKADMTIHNKIADIIDASRNKFSNHQQSLLAICQPYQTRLGHPIHSIFLGMSGYPDKRQAEFGVTVAKMCTPIESSHSKAAFETGEDNGFQFK